MKFRIYVARGIFPILYFLCFNYKLEENEKDDEIFDLKIEKLKNKRPEDIDPILLNVLSLFNY